MSQLFSGKDRALLYAFPVHEKGRFGGQSQDFGGSVHEKGGFGGQCRGFGGSVHGKGRFGGQSVNQSGFPAVQ